MTRTSIVRCGGRLLRYVELIMRQKYCYWSVCTGADAAEMERAVQLARAAGVFKEFHVLTDRSIEGCHCYDAFKCDRTDGLFKLHYLKVGMSRLCFDYFVWIDPDAIFLSNPTNLLECLDRSPIHVPLETRVTELHSDISLAGMQSHRLRDLLKSNGVLDPVYMSGSAFWVVHRHAIDCVYDLGISLWRQGRDRGLRVTVDTALSYATQMLCADPDAHSLRKRPDLWAPSGNISFPTAGETTEWTLQSRFGGSSFRVAPAITHVRTDAFNATVFPEEEAQPTSPSKTVLDRT